MVQVEIPAKDLGHPAARNYQKWTQSTGLLFKGYILESTAPAVCAGIGGTNMSAPEPVNTSRQPSTGRKGPTGGGGEVVSMVSSPVLEPASSEPSIGPSRRLQPSSSAPGGLRDDEAQLLDDLFGTSQKKKQADPPLRTSASRPTDAMSRTTSLPSALPAPYIRGRRELGKQAPVFTVHRTTMLPKRDSATTGSKSDPRDVLNDFSARREASRKDLPRPEPKPVGELDFSPLPTSNMNATYKTPDFTPTPPRRSFAASSPTRNDDVGSPPAMVDDIDLSILDMPEEPLFLPEDELPLSILPRSVSASEPPKEVSVRAPPVMAGPPPAAVAGPSRTDHNFGFEPRDAIIFEPGTYDIILLIDVREVKNKRDEDALRKELSEKGINIEVKNLNLGDMLWIARSRSPHLRADERECVLDYVVERKRLDDLCGSIRDGRYDEQKVSRLNRVPRSILVLICGLPYQFRLNNSCLRNVYYIVEQWNIAGYLGPADSGNTTAQAVATARSQTQVTDGFFVKDTHKLSETVEYLRLLTEIIVETHQVGNVQFEIDGEALTVLERMLRCMSSRLVISREETTTTFKVTFANVTPQHHITPHWTPTNHSTRRPQIVR